MKNTIKPATLTQQIVAYVDDKICGLSVAQEHALTAFIDGKLHPDKPAPHAKPLKRAMAAAALLLLSALVAGAADAGPDGRVNTKLLVGVRNNVQDEITRYAEPKFITPGVLYHLVTNKSEGVIVGRTNLTANIHIVLPNPTNNIGRKFTGIPLGACVIVFSNAVVGSFTDSTTYANATTFTVASNRVGTVYSTGTNYLGVIH